MKRAGKRNLDSNLLKGWFGKMVKVGRPRVYNKLDTLTGLLEFNKAIRYYNSAHSVIFARFAALREVRQDKQALTSLAEYFRQYVPHWNLVANDYEACKYVLLRLSKGIDEFHKKPWGGEYFAKVKIHTSPEKTAYVRKYGNRIQCKAHPNKLGNSEGRCPFCYQRINRLIKMELINEATSASIIDDILKLPKLKGRGSKFVYNVKLIIANSKVEALKV